MYSKVKVETQVPVYSKVKVETQVPVTDKVKTETQEPDFVFSCSALLPASMRE